MLQTCQNIQLGHLHVMNLHCVGGHLNLIEILCSFRDFFFGSKVAKLREKECKVFTL